MARFSWVKMVVDELPLHDLGKAELRVFLALCSDMDSSGVVTRSGASISRQVGLTERSVWGAIRKLVFLNVLQITNCSGHQNTYKILKGAKVGREQISIEKEVEKNGSVEP